MLKSETRSSGSKVTHYVSGSNGEVCQELAKLISYYVNGGYDGKLESFGFNSETKNYEGVFTRYDNCD